jgi:hypothetical protein
MLRATFGDRPPFRLFEIPVVAETAAVATAAS